MVRHLWTTAQIEGLKILPFNPPSLPRGTHTPESLQSSGELCLVVTTLAQAPEANSHIHPGLLQVEVNAKNGGKCNPQQVARDDGCEQTVGFRVF